MKLLTIAATAAALLVLAGCNQAAATNEAVPGNAADNAAAPAVDANAAAPATDATAADANAAKPEEVNAVLGADGEKPAEEGDKPE